MFARLFLYYRSCISTFLFTIFFEGHGKKENISKTDSGVSYSPLAEMELLEKSLNEIFIFDAVTLKFIHANKGACENLGYSLVEFQEMTPLDINTEYTAETFAQLIEPLQNGDKKKIDFETVHLRKNGTC